MKNIGIVCEGPTDFVLLKGIVDVITGEDNHYVALQPEDNLAGEYGNGWKGVWKWCIDYLTQLISSWLKHEDGICIVIPCDSTDTWVAAAYDELPDVEMIKDPWMSIISKGKAYHGVRIPGHKKGLRIYRQFVAQVCDNWENVKRLCVSARQFESQVHLCKQRNT